MVAPIAIEVVPLSPKACSEDSPKSPVRDNSLALQLWQGPALAPEDLLRSVKASEHRLSELLVPRLEARTASIVSCLLSLSLRSALAAERRYALTAPRRAPGDGQVRGLPPLLPPTSPKSPSQQAPDEAASQPARLKRHAHNQSAPGNLSGAASPEERPSPNNGTLPSALSSETQQQDPVVLGTAASGELQEEEQEEERFAPECVRMGLSTNMGQRSSMEDFAFTMPLTRPDIPGCWFKHGACFGVFDGHGGHEVAQSLAEHVPVKIQDSVHHIASSGPQQVGEILVRHERRLRQEPNIWSPSSAAARLPPRYPPHGHQWGRGPQACHRPRSYGAGADPPLMDVLPPMPHVPGMRRGHSSAVTLSAFHNAPQGLVAVKTGRVFGGTDTAPGSPLVDGDGSGSGMQLREETWSWPYAGGRPLHGTLSHGYAQGHGVTSPMGVEEHMEVLMGSTSQPQPVTSGPQLCMGEHTEIREGPWLQGGRFSQPLSHQGTRSSPLSLQHVQEVQEADILPVIVQCEFPRTDVHAHSVPGVADALDVPAGTAVTSSCPAAGSFRPSALSAATPRAGEQDVQDAPRVLAPHTRSQSDVGLSETQLPTNTSQQADVQPQVLLPELQRLQVETGGSPASCTTSSSMLDQQWGAAGYQQQQQQQQPEVVHPPSPTKTSSGNQGGGVEQQEGEAVGLQGVYEEGPWEDDLGFQGRDPGSTALVATIIDGNMFVANVGDCRLILAELDVTTGRVVGRTITNDHVPAVHKGEAARLAALRVPVSDDGYVGPDGGFLQVSRSIGDFSTKNQLGEQVILSEPELHTVQLSANSWFAVAASDGVTCAMSDDAIVNQVCKFLNETGPSGMPNDPHHASEQLVRYAVDAANSPDNASAVVVCFKMMKPPLPQRPRLFGGRALQPRMESTPIMVATAP